MSDEDVIHAMLMNEEVWGTVQCDNCRYWGRMEGIIEANDKRVIKFVCPECNSIEIVDNPERKGK